MMIQKMTPLAMCKRWAMMNTWTRAVSVSSSLQHTTPQPAAVAAAPFSTKAPPAAAKKPAPVSAATTTTAEVSHKPVLQLYGLHARYANALYGAASRAGQLDVVERELNALLQASQTSPIVASFLNNPLLKRSDKARLVDVELKDKLSVLTRNLLATLAGNARLQELPAIIHTFARLMKARRGHVDACVMSAQALTQAQIQDIQAVLQKQLLTSQPKGGTVVLSTKVDPSIVGGLQVQMGDQFLDLSVQSRISEISAMPLD